MVGSCIATSHAASAVYNAYSASWEPLLTSEQLFYVGYHPCREAVVSRMVTQENGVLRLEQLPVAAQQMFSPYEMDFG